MYQSTSPSDSSINIRHFLILALGGHHFLHPFIQELYEEKKWDYYENYRKSGFPDDKVMATYTTKSEEAMRQIAGIVEWSYNHNNFDTVYKIIKKGFKFAYQYVQQRTQIDLEDFVQTYTKRKKGADNITDSEVFNNNIVVLYLCYREGKPCNILNVAGEIFQQGLQDTYFNAMTREIYFNEQKLEENKEKIHAMYDLYPIPTKYDDNMNISRLFEYGIERKTEEIYFRDHLTNALEARNRTFKEPYFKEIGAFAGWIKSLGINEMDLTDLTLLTKKDMDIIFLEYLSAQKENHITEDQRDMFIVACLWMQALAHHYIKTKKLYLDESKEAFYSEIKQREEIVKAKENELQQKEKEWQLKSSREQERIEILEEELRKAQLTIREQHKKEEEMTDYSKEVHALRTYMYEQENQEIENFSVLSIEEMAKEIQNHSVAVFGGHPNWQQKMKAVLPTTVFVDVDELNKNISFIDRLEYVCINTSVFNHTFYRKLMSRLNKNQTKLLYVDGSSNAEKTLHKIYQDICKN